MISPSNMTAQHEWTPEGLQLLLAIESYIKQHGGRHALLNQVLNEERTVRNAVRVKLSNTFNNNARIRRRKKVILINGRKRKKFDSVNDATAFLGCPKNSIRSSIYTKHRIYGWVPQYV